MDAVEVFFSSGASGMMVPGCFEPTEDGNVLLAVH